MLGCGVQEDGLEVLMGLVDSKAVFAAALGLYDLELAAVAAQVPDLKLASLVLSVAMPHTSSIMRE
eukprot:3114262-Rhodomonas_salina.1